MINKSESFIFMGTENSILKSDLEGDYTGSPWIYLELIMSSCLQITKPKRKIKKSAGMQNITESYEERDLKTMYRTDTSHLVLLESHVIEKWQDKANINKNKHVLDWLYNILKEELACHR